MSTRDRIDELAAAQRPGWSLDGAFYTDPAVFERERDTLFRNQWIMAGHVAQLARPGDYFLFDLAGENLILVRDRNGTVQGLCNVCRHRGSRVLLEACGNTASMTCSYHGWSYALDGALRAAPRMGEDFDPADFGLRHCAVMLLEGLIFVCPDAADPPDFGAAAAGLAPFLRLHGTGSARLAQRRVFPVAANWKLAVENYLECYHCKPAHREYCGVEIKAERIGDGSPSALEAYRKREREWRPRAEALGTWLPEFQCVPAAGGDPRRAVFGAAYRAPLRATHLTGSQDGRGVAPLMAGFSAYDSSETALGAGPFTYMLAYSDYATVFQFVPRAAGSCDMIVNWLVSGEPETEGDVDLERLTWLWTVTTEQDKSIIEANAAGVASPSYAPGPPSLLEADLVGFRRWYLAALSGAQAPPTGGAVTAGRYFGF